MQLLNSLQIYLFSAVTHHLSILHLRVHMDYIRHLNSRPSPPTFVPATQAWHHLELRRSPWFDLFQAQDRYQAMRGVWAAMAYLMRDVADEGK